MQTRCPFFCAQPTPVLQKVQVAIGDSSIYDYICILIHLCIYIYIELNIYMFFKHTHTDQKMSVKFMHCITCVHIFVYRSVLATKQTTTPSKGLRWLAQPDARERPGGSSDWSDGGFLNVYTVSMGDLQWQ